MSRVNRIYFYVSMLTNIVIPDCFTLMSHHIKPWNYNLLSLIQTFHETPQSYDQTTQASIARVRGKSNIKYKNIKSDTIKY